MKSVSDDPITLGLWSDGLPRYQGQNMKSASDGPITPGEFVRPPHAQLRSVPDEALEKALSEIWLEIGPCLGSPKADGWRIQIHKKGEEVTLFSRSETTWTKEYRSIADMIRTQVKDAQIILDTELVGFDEHGHHLEPSKLRYAYRYHCYLLDALYLGRRNLTSIPTCERNSFIREHLHNAFCDIFTFAEYINIDSLADLIRFYQQCQKRRKEGFDGAILKRLDTPYFTNVLKLKPKDTVDAVIVGAYRGEKSVVRSLLLAVPFHKYGRLVPIAKVKRTSKDTGWDIMWNACQPFIRDYRPENLDDPPDTPDIWIAPEIVAAVTITVLHPGKGYQVRAEYARGCVLREDKGPEEATSFEQVLQMAGLTEITKTSSEKSKQLQLSLFEENASAISACALDKEPEGTSSEQILLMKDLLPETKLLSERPMQLQLGLFEQ